jgi:ribosome-binding protein aMBF1 (putative translation factor)
LEEAIMGTVIELRIHVRRPVLREGSSANTARVIPFTGRFVANSSANNQSAAGIEPQVRPSVSTTSLNNGDMSRTAKNIGRRLCRTREALGLSQAEFCRQIGVERNVYNPFEKGRRRITLEVATKIRDRYGISLDWIYLADQRALPSDLYQKLASNAA